MNHLEKVRLTEEQATSLIPLYAKATESRRPHPIVRDEKAVEILARVDYDFGRLPVPRKTSITLCMRANKLDDYARRFLAAHPRGSTVLHLGCGLDSRCLRVEHAGAAWYDLDLPEVIELRRAFYPARPGYHLVASSVTDLRWTDAIAAGGPVLAIAEGLLMYLPEADVRALFRKLQAAFPGCELGCDVFSVQTARRAARIPSLRGTGATVRWGIDDARAIESWAPGIRLREEWFFTSAPEIRRLGPGYRLAFGLAGLFTAARRAHRILYFGLSDPAP